jgi:zinc protease
MKELGPFILGLQTKLSNTDEAVQVATQLLSEFQSKGATDVELIAAKKDITGSFPLGVASNANIVQYLGMIGFYQLPLDYLDAFTTKVDALKTTEVQDAFKRRIQPDKLLTVIVGGSEKKPSKTPLKQEVKPSEAQPTEAVPKSQSTGK